ncbi:hypothetical protein D3C73_1207750 [compost metagenome]
MVMVTNRARMVPTAVTSMLTPSDCSTMGPLKMVAYASRVGRSGQSTKPPAFTSCSVSASDVETTNRMGVRMDKLNTIRTTALTV